MNDSRKFSVSSKLKPVVYFANIEPMKNYLKQLDAGTFTVMDLKTKTDITSTFTNTPVKTVTKLTNTPRPKYPKTEKGY